MTDRKRHPKKGGRPTLYKPEYVKQAQNLAFLGATDVQLAEFFGVDERTIYRWKDEYPKFCQALKRGREDADGKVVKSLYRRALGYSHKAVKILTVARGGNMGSEVEEVPYIERYPPDTTAAIFWLKNRRPDQWRDKRDVDLTSNGETLEALVAASRQSE